MTIIQSTHRPPPRIVSLAVCPDHPAHCSSILDEIKSQASPRLQNTSVMFENFHFGASVQPDPASDLCQTAPHDTSIADYPSPTSSLDEPYTPPAMMDLLGRLEQQTLKCAQPQPQRTSYFHDLPTPPLDASFGDGLFRAPSPPSLPMSHALRALPTCRRLQRQLHTRQQTSSQHLRSLAALVEGMVETGAQCSLSTSPAASVVNEPDDVPASDPTEHSAEHDEGYFEGEDDNEGMDLSSRRSSVPSGIRRVGGLSYRSSKDCIRADVVMTRTVVRMRRRTRPRTLRT